MSTRHFLTKRSTEVNWPSGGVQSGGVQSGGVQSGGVQSGGVQLDFYGLSDSNLPL